MKDIAIAGAGGLGREVLVLLHQINEISPQWNILGFYDDNTSLAGTKINQLPYLGTVQSLCNVKQNLFVAIAVGSPVVKKNIVTRLRTNHHIFFPILVHPSVALKPYQFHTLSEGCIVSQGSVLTTNVTFGSHVFLNLNCTIGHNAVLANFVSLMPGVHISGDVTLEESVYVGTNAAVLPGLHIGKDTVIGAGAVVTKAIPHNCTAAGVPAKIIKSHEL